MPSAQNILKDSHAALPVRQHKFGIDGSVRTLTRGSDGQDSGVVSNGRHGAEERPRVGCSSMVWDPTAGSGKPGNAVRSVQSRQGRHG